jgi:hypothetical protein
MFQRGPAETAPPPALGNGSVPASAVPSWPPPGNPTAPGTGAAADYGAWAKAQRPSGRLYGNPDGQGPPQMTTAIPGGHPLEATGSFTGSLTGSLTGHIIRQGRPDAPAPKRNIAKVGIVLVVGLAVLTAIGLLVIFAIGDSFNTIFDGLIE